MWPLSSTSCDRDDVGMTSSIGCPFVYLLHITGYFLPQRYSEPLIFVKTALAALRMRLGGQERSV